jgi:hypothetical protein
VTRPPASTLHDAGDHNDDRRGHDSFTATCSRRRVDELVDAEPTETNR